MLFIFFISKKNNLLNKGKITKNQKKTIPCKESY